MKDTATAKLVKQK